MESMDFNDYLAVAERRLNGVEQRVTWLRNNMFSSLQGRPALTTVEDVFGVMRDNLKTAEETYAAAKADYAAAKDNYANRASRAHQGEGK